MYGVIIVLVILLIIYLSTRDPNITGFWSGDVEFCQTSGISSMLIYFGEKYWTTKVLARDCYMYIAPDIALQQFTIHHGIFSTTAEYDEDDELWPDKLSIARKNDTIYIWDKSKEVLYAKLHARADLNHITE